MDIGLIRFILRIYAAAALVTAAVLSPLALSFIPVVLLIWFLYQWRWNTSPFIDFITQFFVFLAAGLFFSLLAGPYFGCLISLPLIAAFDMRLRDIGRLTRPGKSRRKRAPTNVFTVTGAIILVALAIAIITGSTELMLACGAVIIYLLTVNIIVLRNVPAQPMTIEPVLLRVVAGNEGRTDIIMIGKSGLRVNIFLESPYDWFKITPAAYIPLTSNRAVLKATAVPLLSGPEEINLKGTAIDPWGLMQTRFEIEPVKLMVIPRTRYAEWLARKYMSGTKTGNLPLTSNIGAIKPLFGLRRGIEFYGDKMYQPGDSMKNIDWKHSVKYNELVSKEFSEIQTQPAIMLINLAALNAEEKDKLAFNIIISALYLAQEGVPAALAAYNAKDIVLTTQSLAGRDLVGNALRIVKDIIIVPETTRYLTPPDISRLRANINRLDKAAESKPAKALRELLQIEYKSLATGSRSNPCTRAVDKVRGKVNQLATVIVISGRNHDAEALAFNIHTLMNKGNAVITI